MRKRRHASAASTLENYRVALENAVAQPQIAATLAELGFDENTIDEGRRLLAKTSKAHNFSEFEQDETREAYAKYAASRAELEDTYSLHRKKAKVIFRKDPVILEQLRLSGSKPKAYIKWMDTMEIFYTKALANEEIVNKMKRLKVSKEDMEKALELMNRIKAERVTYQRETSEDQAATMAKDIAFSKIDDWMSEFYAVARIGLEDNPQLLEALGKTIRN